MKSITSKIAGKKQPSSALEFTLVGDAISLQTHLISLQARKNEFNEQPEEDNGTTLAGELMEKYDRKPCLNTAVYLNHPECVRVLLECATKDGPETFKKVMKGEDSNGYCASFMAIKANNLECILVSHCPQISYLPCNRPNLYDCKYYAAGCRQLL